MAISAAMKTHLEASATYLAHLWRVEERPREVVVTWAAASIANVYARGGYLKKNAGTDGTDDAAARSISSFNGDIYVRYRTKLDGTVYFGFSNNNNTATASSIQFAIRVESNGTIKIYEGGTLKATGATTAANGDWLRVQRVGTTITYWHNRTLIYTSATATSSSLYCDTSLVTNNSTINDAVFGYPPTVIKVTDHTRKLTYNSETYTPLPMLPTRFVQSSGLKPNNSELTHILMTGGVTEADLLGGRWDYGRFEFMTVNYLDLTMGVAQRMVGRFGEFKTDNGRFTTELRSLSQPLSQDIGDLVGSLCTARRLGNFECGQPLDSYTHDDSVVSVTNSLQFTVGLSPAKADAYFEYGTVFFRNGENKLYEREIKNNTGNVITLQRPFPFTPQAGDLLTLIAGCNRTLTKCKTFTNAGNPSTTNVENFQGFPHVPGNNKVFRFPE